MGWPHENQIPHSMPLKVHINPNFCGKPNPFGVVERSAGIHLNPHWKPKSEGLDTVKNTETANGTRDTASSSLMSNLRRTIHINPNIIPNGVPQSISSLLQQPLSTNAVPVPISLDCQERIPTMCQNIPNLAIATFCNQKDSDDISSKVKKLTSSPAQLGKFRRNPNGIKSPAIRSAKVICSKYKYLNTAMDPSLAAQQNCHPISKTASFSSRFKYVKRSQDALKPESSLKNHIVSRFKLVKHTSTTNTALTPRQAKAQKILENVKSIPDHTIKSRYRISKGIDIMPRPIITLKNKSMADAGKRTASRYKFVRTANMQRTPLQRKSPRALKSRFKIVRGTGNEASRTGRSSSKFQLETPRYKPATYQANSPFGRRNKWFNSRQDLLTTKIVTSNRKLLRIGRRPENKSDKVRKAKLLKIGGVFYRSTRTTLTRSSGLAEGSSKGERSKNPVKGQVLVINGSKFVLDKTGRTLRRLSSNKTTISRIHIGGVTFVPSTENTLVRSRVHEARNLVSQAKQRSIAVLTSKLRKNNQPCLIFQRFGKCRLHDKGRCPKVHDPKKIAICNDFVNGKCLKSATECRLSHDVGPEKMPTCYFFLEGCCVRDPCPYSHVKLNQKAAVCRDFLSGYCSAGEKCKKRHVFLCPEFEKTKRCSKGKYCSFRHAGEVRARGCIDANSAKESTLSEGRTTSSKEQADSLTRYYFKNDGTSLADEKDGGCHSGQETEPVVLRPERSKLGDLPGFIPL